MISAVDSSVLLDVLCDDARYAAASGDLLRMALRDGRLVVSECVLAEIVPVLGRARMIEWMEAWHIEFMPSSREVGLLAGEMMLSYLKRGGKRGRVVPDFLIGAHAQLLADRLLARDRGFWRDYFKSLCVLKPG